MIFLSNQIYFLRRRVIATKKTHFLLGRFPFRCNKSIAIAIVRGSRGPTTLCGKIQSNATMADWCENTHMVMLLFSFFTIFIWIFRIGQNTVLKIQKQAISSQWLVNILFVNNYLFNIYFATSANNKGNEKFNKNHNECRRIIKYSAAN